MFQTIFYGFQIDFFLQYIHNIYIVNSEIYKENTYETPKSESEALELSRRAMLLFNLNGHHIMEEIVIACRRSDMNLVALLTPTTLEHLFPLLVKLNTIWFV